MEQLAQGYGLVEGPVWEDGKGLLYSDVLFGGVFRLNLDGEVETVFEHRRGIGGMALHEADGLIVSGRNLSLQAVFRWGLRSRCLSQDEPAGVIGFNDLTTDAAGRIYAGALGASPVFDDGREPRAGDLYLVDLDGSVRVVAKDVQLTNGLGFSPDGATLYHSDSRRQTVFCYSVAADGSLGEKRAFAKTAGRFAGRLGRLGGRGGLGGLGRRRRSGRLLTFRGAAGLHRDSAAHVYQPVLWGC